MEKIRWMRVGVAGLLGLFAGCSTAPQGYGVRAVEQQVAQFEQQQQEAQAGTDQAGLYAGLIREMQNKGLYFASLAHIDAYAQRFGRSEEVELMRAHAYRQTQQHDASAAIYQGLTNSKVGAFAWQGLGLIAAANNQYAQASAHFSEAVRRNPTDADMVADYGFSLLKQGRLDEARVPVVQAAELAPGSNKIVGNLAVYLYLRRQASSAEAVMDKANFTPEARQSVRRLAQQIEQAPGFGQPVELALSAPPAVGAVEEAGPRSRATASPAGLPVVRQVASHAVSLPPPSMLDRFTP